MRLKYKVYIFVLFVFYAVVGYLAISPNVSEEYYQYYISKESDISPRELLALEYLKPESICGYSSKSIGFARGWSDPEATHRWSLGKESSIVFRVENQKEFKGNIRINADTLGEQQVVLVLNGVQIYSRVIPVLDSNIDAFFDSALLGNEINTLVFKFPDARQPGNGDQRVLALAIKSFQVR